MTLVERIAGFTRPVTRGLDFIAPALDLGIRLWVANVFWKSGLTKIQSWDTTLALFEHEYHVPLLSPQLAALLGTATELTFPGAAGPGSGRTFQRGCAVRVQYRRCDFLS